MGTPKDGMNGVGRDSGRWTGNGCFVEGSASTFSSSNCAVAIPAVTVMNASHGPSVPTVGVIDAKPFWSLTTWVCEVPRMIGDPSCGAPFCRSAFPCGPPPGPCGMRSSVVRNVTLTPCTGLSEADPSVTRITSGTNGWPLGTICEVPLTASRVHEVEGTANRANVWQGLPAGVTQTLTCTVVLKFVTCAVTLAMPALFVVAVLDESEAVPFVTVNLRFTFACGTPMSSASTVIGTPRVAP